MDDQGQSLDMNVFSRIARMRINAHGSVEGSVGQVVLCCVVLSFCCVVLPFLPSIS